jgi:lysyl-tRNA synthetase class 2
MRWRPVDSSSIAAIRYERRRQRLLVKFRQSGDVYAYRGVPGRIFRELEAAPSKGRYVNYEIKGRYSYERLTSTRSPRPSAPRG